MRVRVRVRVRVGVRVTAVRSAAGHTRSLSAAQSSWSDARSCRVESWKRPLQPSW